MCSPFFFFLIQQRTPIDCRRPPIHWRWSYSGWITYYYLDTHGTLAQNSPQVLIPIIGCCVQFLDNHQSFLFFLPFSLCVRQVFFSHYTTIELARVYHPFIYLFIFEIFASCRKCRHTQYTHTSCDFLLMGGTGREKVFKVFFALAMNTEVLDGRVMAGGFKGWGGRRRNVYEDTVRFGCLVARSRADENRQTYYIYIQHTDGIKIKWGGGTLRDAQTSNGRSSPIERIIIVEKESKSKGEREHRNKKKHAFRVFIFNI